MKTPKEKAEELVEKIIGSTLVTYYEATICAIIAVDEMIIQNGELYLASFSKEVNDFYLKKNNELFQIKQEIQSL